MVQLNQAIIDPSWQPIFAQALAQVDPAYLQALAQDSHWLPGPDKIFKAFSLPLTQTRYILFGESPYPRPESANGYAFWDARVQALWSAAGLAKTVNRATSLRNFIKMLLVAAGALSPNDTSASAIAAVDKRPYVSTGAELFGRLLQEGFLLLNASLVLRPTAVRQDARAWLPFMESLLAHLTKVKPEIELVLFGKIAGVIAQLPSAQQFKQRLAEHPYNLSFIQNRAIQAWFRPLQLLRKK